MCDQQPLQDHLLIFYNFNFHAHHHRRVRRNDDERLIPIAGAQKCGNAVVRYFKTYYQGMTGQSVIVTACANGPTYSDAAERLHWRVERKHRLRPHLRKPSPYGIRGYQSVQFSQWRILAVSPGQIYWTELMDVGPRRQATMISRPFKSPFPTCKTVGHRRISLRCRM